MKPIRTWIVVADGSRARIFENTGPGSGLSALPGRAFETELKANRDVMADRPGRAFDRKGSGRHAMEPTVDWHRFQKREFARALSGRLDRAAEKSAFDRLIIVAPPKSLGDLRETLGDRARSLVTGELPKDLTQCTDVDVARHLENLVVL